jgi:hypothetical protein
MQWNLAEVSVLELIDEIRVLVLIVLVAYVDLRKDQPPRIGKGGCQRPSESGMGTLVMYADKLHNRYQ